MRLLMAILAVPILAFADTNYVAQWPGNLTVAGGVACHPTPEQCRAAGYELLANKPLPPPPTPEEMAASQAVISNQMATAVAKSNIITTLRQDYRNTTHQFCTLSGLTVVDKLSTPAIQAALQAVGSGPTALPLTQLALSLFVTLTDLRREDGEDAWDRI